MASELISLFYAIEVLLGNGRTLRVPSDVEAGALKRIIRIVET